MWGGSSGRRRRDAGHTVLIGLGALLAYFVINLLVLYGSRIQEYYADRGSFEIGNPPSRIQSLSRLVAWSRP